ncbi:MAG: diguanylate cyclase [Cyanobacteria bacterium J06621_12]
MITSLNVLYSQKSDLLPVKQQFKAHPPQQSLIQVFSGWVKQAEIATILEDLKDVFPLTPIIGTTTAGEISDGAITDEAVVVNFSFFESTTVKSSLVDKYDDLWLAGKTLAKDLASSKPKAVILFGCSIKDGDKIDATPILASLSESLPEAIVAGGQAGDNGNGVVSYVFNEHGIVSHGAVAASLSGDKLSVNNSYNLSWIPIGKKLKITKVTGRRVYTIDDYTPLDLYDHYLGSEVVTGLPLAAADFPLIIEREGTPMAIHPLGVNDDGSFNYMYSFEEGEQVQFGFCHSGLLRIGAKQTFDELKTNPIQAAFIYSCVSRKWILGQDINIEIAPLSKLALTAGFFAYGEYFTHHPRRCVFLSQTMTVLTLAESDPTKSPILVDELKSFITEEESRQFKTLRVLHRLVETSTREIEVTNQKLVEAAHKDGLTGLANRRYFDRQLSDQFQLAQKTGNPLSLILIDVDEFKLYNDTYGHVEGDCCLRRLSSMLKQIFSDSENLAARYGGEEFVCILPNTNFVKATLLAKRIKQDLTELAIPHATSRVINYLTVSMGIQTLNHITPKMTPKSLIELCDKQLYHAKRGGRNRFCGKQTD